MKKSNKNLKNRYRVRLLQEFNRLKSEGSMVEVLEYIRFIREQEKQLEKLTHIQKHSSYGLERPYSSVDNSKKLP